jgi:hypothetical protein
MGIAPETLVHNAFPCHPEITLPVSRSRWLDCPACGTRVLAGSGAYTYGNDYPATRGHHDPAIGRCKVRTLERWLKGIRIDVSGRVVCEIGFGGAACLAALQRQGATVLGLEPVPANRAHAESLGIPGAHLFDVDPLPHLPFRPSLWLLQDTFEHVPDPNALARWMTNESSEISQVLLVAPDAQSISRKLMGRFWLHQVPDHHIHYSQSGVASIFARARFRVVQTFRPVKLVSLAMVRNHLRVLAGATAESRSGRWDRVHIWFNIGEMGLLLEQNDNRR